MKILQNIIIFYSLFLLTINNLFANSNCLFGLCKVDNGIKGNENTNITEPVNNLMVYLLSFLALIAIIMILWAGFNIMTAAGDDEKVKKGKNTIIYTLIGVLVIFSAYQIVMFVFDGFK